MNESQKASRWLIGKRNRAAGEYFEREIELALRWYEDRGLMKATKTPEPMKPIKPVGDRGQFLACYTKRAQVDFSGTIRGGRAVRFEAKHTDTGRFDRDRLTLEQMNDLREHDRLGAMCFVLLCFGDSGFYRVPWRDWDGMKKRFGRLYITEADALASGYRLPFTGGVIRVLDGIEDGESWPDLCVSCGDYAGEGSHICGKCRKETEK